MLDYGFDRTFDNFLLSSLELIQARISEGHRFDSPDKFVKEVINSLFDLIFLCV
jgi:hypothetical protein